MYKIKIDTEAKHAVCRSFKVVCSGRLGTIREAGDSVRTGLQAGASMTSGQQVAWVVGVLYVFLGPGHSKRDGKRRGLLSSARRIQAARTGGRTEASSEEMTVSRYDVQHSHGLAV